MMIKKLKNWVKSFFVDEEQQKMKQRIKNSFRNYFEGISSLDIEPEFNKPVGYPVYNFGICKIDFKFRKKQTEMIINLERPGLLIGKAGTTINGVTEYLNNCRDEYSPPIKITIIESNLWYGR